jgi:hypothetical protein
MVRRTLAGMAKSQALDEVVEIPRQAQRARTVSGKWAALIATKNRIKL